LLRGNRWCLLMGCASGRPHKGQDSGVLIAGMMKPKDNKSSPPKKPAQTGAPEQKNTTFATPRMVSSVG
jgi:hypothetical protein